MPPFLPSSSRRAAATTAAVIALACLAAGTWSCTKTAKPSEPPRNVVLLIVDTLRADHLGAYGYARPTSPFLDSLADNGVLFENLTSAAPVTFPSVNTILTGRRPSLFFKKSAAGLGIPEEMTTLAEIFQSHGFATAAVSASPVVRNTPSAINGQGAYGWGFDTFDESCCDVEGRSVPAFSSDCVADRAVALLDDLSDKRFFLYLHFLDPHDPYRPPEEHNVFTRPYEGKHFVKVGTVGALLGWAKGTAKKDPEVTERDLEHLIDLYDGEIHAVDAQVERVLAAFRERALIDDTLFVVVSDHGESFLEHERAVQHGLSLYQTELHVPLLFYWPRRWKEGRRIEELVCGIDLMPTIASLAHLPVPAEVAGRPLFDVTASFATRREPRCLSVRRHKWKLTRPTGVAARDQRFKVLYDEPKPLHESYDLHSDPGEQHDLAFSEPGGASADDASADLETLRTLVDRRLAETGGDNERVRLDPEAEEALRSLGYIE